jgi:hypothetical protein
VSASRTANGAPVQLQVQVPSDVQVGEVFQAQVHVQANTAVRQLVFAIAYDKSRLALVGSSAGNFAEQGGSSAEFGAEEPSDGNIQVSVNVRSGASMAGAGNLGNLSFRRSSGERRRSCCEPHNVRWRRRCECLRTVLTRPRHDS